MRNKWQSISPFGCVFPLPTYPAASPPFVVLASATGCEVRGVASPSLRCLEIEKNNVKGDILQYLNSQAISNNFFERFFTRQLLLKLKHTFSRYMDQRCNVHISSVFMIILLRHDSAGLFFPAPFHKTFLILFLGVHK